ncbi:MAG TPA: glycine zipper 2TM domain-containing protein [Ramlibacter sp.]|uniref:glycine zipper 2TM domain-containing protein n=1 Tax=Ramlibacter sp. TaxID=1917967 RepID=UPI002CCE64C9|nr:glycine zipper 2TM domain-containing protein [Ramlibacter sp.]HVZ46305.1 glycine zipper 2TM domain-containing protein [Ramlibacter sp.]
MRTQTRLAALVSCGIAAASLAACSTTYPVSYNTYPSTTTTVVPASSVPVGMEYGRVTSIEYLPVGSTMSSGPSILGAIVGGVAGAALGSTIGAGAGRTAATVLGGVGGAALGSHIARNAQGATTVPGYRITMLTDSGITRVYEVPATGDLHVGDRVRVDGGVIYRA